MKKRWWSTLVIVCSIILVTAGTVGVSAAQDPLVIASKGFTEQYIIGNMMSVLLREAGFKVKENFGVGSSIARKGLLTGQVDLYAEYTGTAWAVHLKHADEKVNDPIDLYNRIKEEDAQNGIVWLERSTLNNTYALAIRRKDADKYGRTLSELAAYSQEHPKELSFGVSHEFYKRADGFFAMAEEYGLEVQQRNVKPMEIGLTFEAINRGQIDVAMVFATDGKLKKYNLLVLEDDRQFFPVYNIAVCIRKAVLDRYPEIREILKPISELDNETMQELNYKVDAQGIPEPIVARQYLKEKGYID